MKGWTAGTSTPADMIGAQTHEVLEKEPPGDAPPVPEDTDHQGPRLDEQADVAEEGDEDEDQAPPKPLWGPTSCCISCVSTPSSRACAGAHLIS